MEKSDLSTTRSTVVKIHVGVLLFMVAGLFVVWGRVPLLTDWVVLYLIIMLGHASAVFGHLARKNQFRYLSTVLAVVLIPLFPIGSIFGFILLGQSTKKEWSSDAAIESKA
ncbi:hypothetical protein [Alcanivorax sp.]|uniref:hypothetical protein n=1 Tax=Alcanivorax sp. TaxID=1872427 RepID=UPI002B269C0E|nr:hypothetical protein [Alcanivorax sp.]